jgi:beta-glucosidase
MSSYNQINNSYSSQNSWTLNYLLKNELSYQGFVMSDWGGHHSGVSSAVAGLDMDMPGDIDSLSGKSYWGANLTLAVANGTIPQWRLDDMCMRIMAAYYKVGRDKVDIPVNFNSYALGEYGPIYPYIEESPIGLINEDVYVRGNHKDIIREIGRASIVLLKNDGALPFDNEWKHYGLFGSDAGPNPYGANGCQYRLCDNGTLAEGWGSGAFLYPYLIDPSMAIMEHVTQNTKASVSTITENFDADEQIQVLGSQIDTALVFVNSNSGEGAVTVLGNYGDRNNITFWLGGDELIKQVASMCNKTIVVMHTVGPVLVTEWYDNPNITAILWAGLPGQESGNSLTDVLWGDYNPSGKLPFTFAKKQEDYGRSVMYEPNNGHLAPQQQLTSLNIDYRYFDAEAIDPIYEFGFGLSYTTFEYSDLSVTDLDAAACQPASGMTKPAPTFGEVTLGHYVSPTCPKFLFTMLTSLL